MPTPQIWCSHSVDMQQGPLGQSVKEKFTDTVKSMPKVLKRHRISPITSIMKENTLRGNTTGNYFKIISFIILMNEIIYLFNEKSSLTK